MTSVKRPLQLGLSSQGLSSQAVPASFCPPTPSKSVESSELPSLILPYLYVGDLDNTHLETISRLDISYILSLQSLPKFLTKLIELKKSSSTSPKVGDKTSHYSDRKNKNELVDNSQEITATSNKAIENQGCQAPVPTFASVSSNDTTITITTTTTSTSDTQQSFGPAIISGADDGHLLPSENMSKDYLVRIGSKMKRLIRGKCINISDTLEQLVDKFFDESQAFIHEARRNKCNILIHCKAGISRAPTIVIAYLMKLQRLQLQDAYNMVRQCRPQISPNLNFMGQLVNYERKLLTSSPDSHQQARIGSQTRSKMVKKKC